jgi:hypothetical protein
MKREDVIEQAHQQLAECQRAFQKAHEAGMAALHRGDYRTLSQAIADESEAIATLKKASEHLREAVEAAERHVKSLSSINSSAVHEE